MFDRLESLVHHFEELMAELGSENAAADPQRYRALMKEQAELKPLVEAYQAYAATKRRIEDEVAMLETEKDEEMRALLKEEISDDRNRLPSLEEELKVLMIPKDPNDEKNVIMEIRSGVGGEEAALFAADLYRMYVHYAGAQRWKVETVDFNDSALGGMNKVVCIISGKGAYSRLKFESGVHQVKRVPKTESQGRIHTSTCTVAIMPEAAEVDVTLDLNDCRFDVFRASGNGGQCVNTTDSAVRLTHIPTGIVISCQDEKSQLKNKDKALKILRSKLFDLECRKKQEREAEERRSQIGFGERAEKIRTYNYPHGRVTDHRVGLTLYKLESIMDGDLDELIQSNIALERSEKLSKMEEQAV